MSDLNKHDDMTPMSNSTNGPSIAADIAKTIESLRDYFRSGNHIPVERAVIRHADWLRLERDLESIKAVLSFREGEAKLMESSNQASQPQPMGQVSPHAVEYPPLPEGTLYAIDQSADLDPDPHYEQVPDAESDGPDVVHFYTADQMRAYVDADRARRSSAMVTQEPGVHYVEHHTIQQAAGTPIHAIKQAIDLIGEPKNEPMKTVLMMLRGTLTVAQDSGIEAAYNIIDQRQ